MAAYQYRAISRGGTPVSGVMEAYDEFEAIERIKETCDIVTSISEAKIRINPLQMELGQVRIREKPLALLCSQFSIILSAGLPVVRAVRLIEDQTNDRRLKKLLNQVAEDVAAGYGLSQSFENKGKKYFPTTFIETLRAGEESGTLELAFRKLHRYYDKSAKVKSQVRSAMIYPIFLCVLAIAVVAFIMAVVMPTFVVLFSNLNADLPALTRGLMAVSTFFSSCWPGLLAAIALTVIAFKLWSGTEKGRLRLARLQLHLPALGRVAEMRGASQLANTLSTLLTAGLPLLQAVSSTARVLDNYYLRLRLGAVVSDLESGGRLGDCLKECGCFPDMLVEMAAVGEESGTLEQTFDTIGAYYDSEVEIATKRALDLLQPSITVVMGILIGIIVIALYLPMFSMYANM